MAQLINVGGLPILSRLYGTEAFATLAVFLSIGLIVLSFSTFQLDLAIVKTQDLKERVVLAKTAFFSVLIIATMVSMLTLCFGNYVNPAINFFFTVLLFVYLITNAGNQILIFFFNSEKEYRIISLSKILLNAVNLFLAILFFYGQYYISLIQAITMANVVSFLCLIFFFRKNIRPLLQIQNPKMGIMIRKNFNFIKYSTPAKIFDVLAYQIIILVASAYFTEKITGSFFMAMRIVLLPSALIGYAVGQVFYKDISDKIFKQQLTSKSFYQIWKILFALAIIPFGILFFYGELLFQIVLGEGWELAGKFATIISLVGFFNFMSSPTSSGYVVLGKQHFNLVNSFFRTFFISLFLWISYREQDFFLFLYYYTFVEVALMILYNLGMIWLVNNQKIK
ncbi:MAG: oligosaccharide flippase family protein [Bacteroidota bacterium]